MGGASSKSVRKLPRNIVNPAKVKSEPVNIDPKITAKLQAEHNEMKKMEEMINQFQVKITPQLQYPPRKENELIGILKKRDVNHEQEVMPVMARRKRGVLKYTVADINHFYSLHKQKKLSESEIGERFGFDKETQSTLLKYWNTPEIVQNKGSDGLETAWVEDLTTSKV